MKRNAARKELAGRTARARTSRMHDLQWTAFWSLNVRDAEPALPVDR
jgi:hypothetical protein